ncbi:glycoside hydrolase family 16 protein [Agromyces bauzanensis]|uniref:GH16 domain-containing protein n=1 Tax=Agromyces bauzanensis TaxID=1308924 RepID=A0A917PKZ8_9MICO|nr:hypothetical protein [Agromyces bauzanensis]GGJ83377.1 hypothetical protein GCM10011372_22140 [Agromyces bauzanensis]
MSAGIAAVLFATPAASAASLTFGSSHSSKATLELESPAPRSTVSDTTEFAFSGANLGKVVLYSHGKELAVADVAPDGASATATVDTLQLEDGYRALVAIGWSSSTTLPQVIETVLVKVDNTGADAHPSGAELVFSDEFSGSELDRDDWCTRYQFWEPTSQPSQEELTSSDPGCYHIAPLTERETGRTTTILNQYKDESAKAAAAGETAIAGWYDTRIEEISENTGVLDNGDGTYDFSRAYPPAYGFHDTLGGFDIRPAPNAPEWELPQEEEVYRDVNSEGQELHTVQDGYLSLWATHTRQDAPVLQYESAMIRSKEEFLPTWDAPLYLTARVRAPKVLGTFPAFWTINGFGDGTIPIGWPPEIDFYEGPYNNDGTFPTGGQFDNQYHVGLVDYLCGNECGPITWFDFGDVLDGSAGDEVGFDTTYHDWHADRGLAGEWVEVGAAWYPDRVCFFADGEKFACATYRWGLPGSGVDGPLANPGTLLLNHAFGGRWGGHNGEEVDKLPAAFDVDHVRVYQLGAVTAAELSPAPGG